MEVLISFIALTILGIAAQLLGNDSRDGFDDQPAPEPWHFPGQHG